MYDGPIISDDMQMKAISDHYGLAEACCLAINAGVDIIIIGNNLDHKPFILRHLIDSVEEAVEQGAIRESRIEEAYKKTLTLKQQL
jgi:beta-N-acetylhexosaminidase